MPKNERILRLCCLLAVLVMSPIIICETSPLYQTPNADNAIFLSMGKAIADGLTPYVDVSENKGPLFFLLMAIPQMFLDGTTGVYLLQTAMLLVYCWFILHMTRWFVPQWKHPLVMLLPLMWCVARYGGQNFCEEYDRFFTLIGMSVIIRAYAGRMKAEKWYAFVLGLCTAAVLLIKMSDIVTLGVTCLFYLHYVIRMQRSIWKEMLGFTLGALVISVPVFAYLASVGAVDAMLQEYLLSNITHVIVGKDVGFWESRMYLIRGSYGEKSFLPLLMMAAALVVSAIIKPRSKRDHMEMRLHVYGAAVAASTLLIAYVASSGFKQHLMLGQLTELVAILLILRAIAQRLEERNLLERSLKGAKALTAIACAAFVLCWGLSHADDAFIWTDQTQEYIAYLREFEENIADSESVYTIGVTPQWYWHNGVQPCYRYYNLRGFIEDHVGVDLAEKFEYWLIRNPIETWIIAGEIEDYRGILSDETLEFMHSNYEYYSECSEGTFKLLRLI